MLDGFETLRMERDGVALHVRRAGRGAPLLLLHGHPQTQAMWHRVAPELAQAFEVVLMTCAATAIRAGPRRATHPPPTPSARWRWMHCT